MTTIAVPARIGAIDELEATAAASSVTTAFRGSATGVSDVSSWTRARGAPTGWTGDAADAATHAMTGFAGSTDVVVAALEKAARACDTYVDQVVALTKDRADLVADRSELNAAIDALAADINASTEADVESLRSRSERLQARVTALTDRVVTFWERVATAEDRLISALRSVDTTAEAGREATRSGRPDSDALRRDLEALGDDPAAVTRWWKGLTDAEREALKISDPDLVGNTNGIPTGDRDEANRTSLERDLDRMGAIPTGDRTDEEQALLERARKAEQALGIPGLDIDPNTGLPVDVNLIVYQPTAFGGDGAAAVSYGDPDTADNTAVVVPGITNDGTSIASQGTDAYRLFQQASLNGESTASIAWMGYDSPSWNPQDALDWPGDGLDMGSVVREDKAVEGGVLLAQFVDGLRATDEGDASHLSVIGHSYGSTTVAHAAHDQGLGADSLTLIGSPGAGGDHVDGVADLGMPQGKVYVGAADNDFVTWLGRDGDLGMGRDPAQADFGAHVFPVAPGDGFHADNLGQGITNHTSYFDQGSQSLDSLTTIVQGDEPTTVPGRSQDANDLATDWVKDEIRYQVDREVDAAAQEVEESYHAGKDWVGDRVDDFKGLWP
jgi:pimeloyl-ACP methyl ester carboxylesterase